MPGSSLQGLAHLQAVGAFTRSFIQGGGEGSLVSVVNADDGSSGLESDTVGLLQALVSSHPAVSVLKEACFALHKSCASREAWMVTFTGFLSAGVASLLSQGFPRESIVSRLGEAACLWEDFCSKEELPLSELWHHVPGVLQNQAKNLLKRSESRIWRPSTPRADLSKAVRHVCRVPVEVEKEGEEEEEDEFDWFFSSGDCPQSSPSQAPLESARQPALSACQVGQGEGEGRCRGGVLEQLEGEGAKVVEAKSGAGGGKRELLALLSLGLGPSDSSATELALAACLLLHQKGDVDPCHVDVVTAVGPPSHKSRAYDGCCLPLSASDLHSLSLLRQDDSSEHLVRVVVLEGGLTPAMVDSTVAVLGSAAELTELLSLDFIHQYAEGVVEVLQEQEVTLVLAESYCHPRVVTACHSAGIAVLSNLGPRAVRRASLASGAREVADIFALQPCHVSPPQTVDMMEGMWFTAALIDHSLSETPSTEMEDVQALLLLGRSGREPSPTPVTVVLCAPSLTQLKRLRSQLWGCLSRTSSTLQDEVVLVGDGSLELKFAAWLSTIPEVREPIDKYTPLLHVERHNELCSHLLSRGTLFKALAGCMESMVHVSLINTGFTPTDALDALARLCLAASMEVKNMGRDDIWRLLRTKAGVEHSSHLSMRRIICDRDNLLVEESAHVLGWEGEEMEAEGSGLHSVLWEDKRGVVRAMYASIRTVQLVINSRSIDDLLLPEISPQ